VELSIPEECSNQTQHMRVENVRQNRAYQKAAKGIDRMTNPTQCSLSHPKMERLCCHGLVHFALLGLLSSIAGGRGGDV
jgi:hypothetical protein